MVLLHSQSLAEQIRHFLRILDIVLAKSSLCHRINVAAESGASANREP